MLGARYQDDGNPTLNLNKLQEKVKAQITKKIEKGEYIFSTVKCIVCKKKDFTKIANKDRYGIYHPTVICKKCGLMQANPRMSDENYNEFYKKEQKLLYVGRKRPNQQYFDIQYTRGKRIYDFIKKNQNSIDLQNSFVLEIGCGAGGILEYFKGKGNEIIGFDINSKYIEYGVSRGLKLINKFFSPSDINKAPDIIILSHILEHLLDPIKELSKIKHIMKKSTILYVEVPGIKSIPRNYNYDLLRYLQNAHVYHFTLNSLQNLLKKTGFTLIQGNEYIRSVFKLSDTSKFKTAEEPDFIVNDYCETLKFLQKLEIERNSKKTKVIIKSFELINNLKSIMGKLLFQ